MKSKIIRKFRQLQIHIRAVDGVVAKSSSEINAGLSTCPGTSEMGQQLGPTSRAKPAFGCPLWVKSVHTLTHKGVYLLTGTEKRLGLTMVEPTIDSEQNHIYARCDQDK